MGQIENLLINLDDKRGIYNLYILKRRFYIFQIMREGISNSAILKGLNIKLSFY